MIENEVSYLAFPPVDRAVAVFGGGYAATVLEQLGRSLLMDRATLLAHEGQWAQEATPLLAYLAQLRPAESELYHDLVEQRFGQRVRLEQERVSYAAVTAAVSGES